MNQPAVTDDLVQRLRTWERGAVGRPSLYDEAADALERLQADNQRLSGELALMQNWRNVDVETFHAQAAEVVRLQQALRDLTKAAAFHLRQPVALETYWETRTSLKASVVAARAVLNGDQQ